MRIRSRKGICFHPVTGRSYWGIKGRYRGVPNTVSVLGFSARFPWHTMIPRILPAINPNSPFLPGHCVNRNLFDAIDESLGIADDMDMESPIG